jgi:hypothetical protein
MRNSDNTTPIFVDTPPDWSVGVKIALSHTTMLNTTRAGLEQRERGRRYATRRITYQRRGLTLTEWQERFVRVLAEMQTLCIVPFWEQGLDAIRRHSGTKLRASPGKTIRSTPGGSIIACNQFWQILPPEAFLPELWRDCDYAYITNGETGYFASIMSIRADPKLALRSRPYGNIVRRLHPFGRLLVRTARMGPHLTPPATEALSWDSARIYPCLECRRVPDQESEKQTAMQSRDEMLIFETI